MSGSSIGPARAGMERTWSRWVGAGGHLGMVLAIAAAIALWAAMVSAVAAPLGDALARIEARERPAAPPACAAPPDAVASAARRPERTCP